MYRHLPTRRTFLAGLTASLAAPTVGRASGLQHASGHAFGTTWGISCNDPEAVEASQRGVTALFAEIDKEMSPWRADSTISQFNRNSTGVIASAELSYVTQAGLDLAALSEGAFDPTVGPLVARWGFGPITQGALPDWRGVSLANERLTKNDPDLTLDLCGIAKGRALDRAADLVRALGLGSALIDLGGELRAVGQHPEGRDWRVAIENPLTTQPAGIVLNLPAGFSVATSGVGTQGYGRNGQVWGHIMDPMTAHPVAGKLRSVTVIGTEAMVADGWATALFAAGDHAGPEIARAQDIAAVFLFDTGTGLRRIETGGIAAVLS
jgi:thiamine biosynthesis lipoprotein